MHVTSKLLAASLRSIDIPLKQRVKEKGGIVSGIANVYSEEHPFRRNNIIVPGRVTYYFEPFSRDGKIKTEEMVKAWNEAGENMEKGIQPQAFDEIEKLHRQLLNGDLGEKNRTYISNALRFWTNVLMIQQNRAAYQIAEEFTRLTTNPRELPPLVQWKRPSGSTNFYTPARPQML